MCGEALRSRSRWRRNAATACCMGGALPAGGEPDLRPARRPLRARGGSARGSRGPGGPWPGACGSCRGSSPAGRAGGRRRCSWAGSAGDRSARCSGRARPGRCPRGAPTGAWPAHAEARADAGQEARGGRLHVALDPRHLPREEEPGAPARLEGGLQAWPARSRRCCGGSSRSARTRRSRGRGSSAAPASARPT